jgi:hypothetical protein
VGRAARLERDRAVRDPRHAHRVDERAAALGRRPGVEDLKALLLGVLGHVRVAEDHRLAVRERRAQARQPAGARAGSVDHPEADALELPFHARGKQGADRGRVDVAVDGVHRRAERAQQLEDRDVAEIAGVQDRVGLTTAIEAAGRDRPVPARHVRVADDRDLHRRPGS